MELHFQMMWGIIGTSHRGDPLSWRISNTVNTYQLVLTRQWIIMCLRPSYMLFVGFNPIWKLPTNEFLKAENKNGESIKHKTYIHRDFLFDPKTGTTRLIFHYTPFNVTIHIYTCWSIHKPQSINPGLEHNHSSLDWIYKIPWTEKYHAQNHVWNPWKN